MCFKKDVQDLTSIENIKLNGGECKSAYSLNDMKKDGWEVSDIKINNNDYIYILKKGAVLSWNGSSTDMDALEEKLLKKMEEKRKEEIKKKKIEATLAIINNGKAYYEKKCQSCHGINGEEEPGFAVKIKDLTKDQFLEAMDGYRLGSYNKGSADQMKAYALTSSQEDTKNVYEYLNSINQKVDTK
jgi:mono/diheme cytochrome c family protein